MSIQQLFFSGGDTAGKTVFTTPGSFTVPSGITSITVKLFAAGGQNGSSAIGGSGSYIIGNMATVAGDILSVYNTGDNYSVGSSATLRRGGVLYSFALAGAGGSAGQDGSGDDQFTRAGGNGGDGGPLYLTGSSGNNSDSGGTGGTGGSTVAGIGGYAASGGTNGSNGSGPGTADTGTAAGGNGGIGGTGDETGGNGGKGGGGNYGGGGGGGGGFANFPDTATGGGGGGGGSSFANGMTSLSSGICSSLSDPDRGTAGNPDTFGKVVVIY